MVLEKLLSHLAIHVEPFALCQLSTGCRAHLPGPREVMLHYVLQGKAAVRGSSGARHALGPNWLAVVPRGVRHVLEWDGRIDREEWIEAPPEGAPVCRIVVGSPEKPDLIVACGSVKVRYGQSLDLFDHLDDLLAVDLSGAPQVRNAIEAILAEQAQLGPGSGVMTAALMTQCLVHLLRRLGADVDCPLPWLAALSDSRLSRAIEQVLGNPGAIHTVESLAEAASMSRSSFAERFAEAFGRTPMGLVHHVRMQQAARLLGQGDDLSIDDVAGRVGFSSRSHFSRAFKKHCGLSPASFRASQRLGPQPRAAARPAGP